MSHANEGPAGAPTPRGQIENSSERSLPRHERDEQRGRVYRWERAILPPEAGPSRVVVRRPFEDEFLQLHREAWAWGVERFTPDMRHLPDLRFSSRATRRLGAAGFRGRRIDGKEYMVPTITLSFNGIKRAVLLHEQAHWLTGWRTGHTARFCRIALDLYVRFLGIDETSALCAAVEHQIEIDPPVGGAP